MSERQAAIDEQNVATLRQFQRVLNGELPPGSIYELTTADFCVFEPDVFDKPVERDKYHEHLARPDRPNSTFDFAHIEPVGNTLVVDLRWTPPHSDEGQQFKMVWSFRDGLISRCDAGRANRDEPYIGTQHVVD